ncbi:MAG: hypothetical protein Q4G22_01635 [Paracoccus sp. (in: a-proteobacteria)]|uniref:hypothetical protein n=1 Tax=Paracoccus sp. TaxID=267 RepID=UPI0026DFB954|nr:hypothetical protein [Paracoccus sp. (in: a-proteobacteria)]MDO5630518.1 hypothetical protein [Paracoccus sp. (in: a-proteobacteria)]
MEYSPETKGIDMRFMAGLAALLVAGTAQADISLVASQLTWDSPEVQAAIGPKDQYAADGKPGCFIDSETLTRLARERRAWDADTAEHERVRFFAAGILAGEVTIFSDSPLRTPVSFQALRGDCAKVPNKDAIARSHTYLIANLDRILRNAGARTPCGSDATAFADALFEQHDPQAPNAWMPLEVFIIALGSDWIQGNSLTEKGWPRPPLCYEDGENRSTPATPPPPSRG